ncbi:MAG TPA: bifunctional acetaldehyde-CoA/alcohol dehydrogenase [Firmicutes bacterium]|nr:bifunctional acetaldehyde-CoA/alcohol dehydrogenase [Bacillota bacterium]
MVMAEKTFDYRKHIDQLVAKAKEAQVKMLDLTQDDVDRIVKAMALAGVDHHMELAHMAVDETGKGVYEDKVTKNLFATEYVYHDIKREKTVGIIEDNAEEGYLKIAEPVGIIAGLTPVTNPTSTTMFKSLISLKTRNVIIFSFHPYSLKSSIRAATIMKEAAIKAGAPEGCISWVETPSVEATNYLMQHKDVAIILATGGAGMVNAAYSSGKPALGVGPGNVPAYIEKTANLYRAVNDLILSKTFDNGMICASEQAVIVDKEISEKVKKLFEENGGYFLKADEIKKVEEVAIDKKRQSMSPQVVGQPAVKIAKLAGIRVPEDTRVLLAELEGVGPDFPLSREKLSPILAFYVVENYEEGIKRCEDMTEFGGLGHSAVIHSKDEKVIREFGKRVRTGRLLVNCPSAQGAIGDIYTNNNPSLTLGCGSMGRNSTTDNVSVENLLNIKRLDMRRVNMKWFRVPPRVYFEPGSLEYLSKMHWAKRAVIVTDPTMVDLGFVDKVTYQLEKIGIVYEVFSEVEPDPSVETVQKGVALMEQFRPDTIIALGGGSPMDAAKGMWLFYEHPETEFDTLRLKFMDIRKRTFTFPELGNKAKLVAIPTTSGTGSEVTSFAVITDKKQGIKYPLADYQLTPDIAIIDPNLVKTVPPRVTADTGMDVLVHGIEAYVSVMASDYTDALAIKSIQIVFEYLERSYKNGQNDVRAREKMHNASCMAGMAFTNAFLGLNHSMAHVLGARFHIPHGRANAILLPWVIRYNAQKPSKRVGYPKYEFYQAPERFADIAKAIGLHFNTNEEAVDKLIEAIVDLAKRLDMPLSLKEAGIDEKEFAEAVDMLADTAFADQCTITNPRLPLVEEIKEVYWQAYYGKEMK